VTWLARTHGVKLELMRHFLGRMLDGEWSTSPGQWQQAAIGMVALFLPAGLLLVREGSLAANYSSKYRLLEAAGAVDALRAAPIADELALITLLCSITGLIALIEWQALFPSGRDYLALAAFPVRSRQIFAARFFTVMLFSAGIVAALNWLPSLIAPAEFGGGWHLDGAYLAQAAAQAAASGLACFFTFFAIVALQGVLLNLLPGRWFARVSVYVQGLLVAIFLLAGLYSWTVKDWQPALIGKLPQFGAWLPPVWFTGLHRSLSGTGDAFFAAMSSRGLRAAASAFALTLATYLLSYRRYRTLLVETPVRLASPRTWPWSLSRVLARSPRRVAIVEFMAKTLARSRTHRVIWLAYLGGAVAIMLNSSLVDGALFLRAHSVQKAVRFAVLFWPLACSVILISGFRHVISIPAELPANWLFRITESQGRREWMSAVERVVVAYAIAPVYLLLFPVAVAALGWPMAIRMTVLQVLVSLSIFECLFHSWQQLPFTCSYLPGKRPLVLILSSYFIALCALVPMLTVMISTAAMVGGMLPGFYIAFLANFGLIWFFARRRRRDGWGEARILYEDLPQVVLDLGIKELTYAGTEAQFRRTAAGNAGYADPQDPDSGTDARLRGSGVHPADVRGRAESGGGCALSGAASSGIARPAGGRMGDFGEQPPRQILPADRFGTPSPGRRSGSLEPHGDGHLQDHGAGIILPEFVSIALHRLRALFRRRQLDRDLEDELQFHLDMRARETGDAAQARRQFGNITRFKETCRDMWTLPWFETFLQDLRYAVRQLRLRPGFTAVAALTLSLGIAATTVILSSMDTLVLQPMLWVQPPRFAVILQDVPGEHVGNPLTPADMEDIRRAPSLESLSGWDHTTLNVVDSGGEPIRVETARITTNFFDVVGVQPALGRGFLPGEDQPGREQVAVLSDDLWRRHFNADPRIVGKTIRAGGHDVTVTGVMPPKFRFPRTWREMWIPLSLPPELRDSRTRMVFEAGVQLKPGHTLPQLAAELRTIGGRLAKQYPETNRGRHFSPWTLERYTVGDYAAVYVSMLFAAAFFVLLIACVNVANLQFARATGRGREVAVRTALGAGRSRIVRQLVTESLVLAALACGLGLLFSKIGLAVFKAAIPAEMRHYLPTWKDMGLNPHTLLFAVGAAALSALLAGLLPAWRCSRPNLVEALKEGSRSSGGPRRNRLRTVLVAGQMAMAVMLLVGAGLMVASFRGMIAGQPNLDRASLLTLSVALDSSRYRGDAVPTFYRDVLARLRALPGVRSAAAVTALPYSRAGESYALTIEGRPPQHGNPPMIFVQSASPDYFPTLGIALRSGRLLSDADTAQAPAVAVIGERMLRRWWPEEKNAAAVLGKRIRLGPPSRPWLTIVGVSGDIHQSALELSMIPIVYVSDLQSPKTSMNIAVRTEGDAMRLASAVTAAVRSVDREQPIENLTTLDGLLHQEIFVFAYMAWLMGIFGVVALTLAVVGVYGLMSYLVSQQTHDIGVRIALGAPRGRVIGVIFRHGMIATGIGLAIGMLPALALARLLAFALWGVRGVGPATFLGIPLVLASAAALAIYVPARRAVAIDPMVALRDE
jgi:putative ABC transport system permease protein